MKKKSAKYHGITKRSWPFALGVILLVLARSMSCYGSEEFHIFSSKDERLVTSACVLSYNNDEKIVTLKKEGGKIVKVNTDALKEDDVAYIKEWHLKKLIQNNKLFQIDAKNNVRERWKEMAHMYESGVAVERVSATKFEKCAFDINLTISELDQLIVEKIDYHVILLNCLKTKKGWEDIKTVVRGRHDKFSLKKNKKYSFSTTPVETYYVTHSPAWQSSVFGLYMKIYVKGEKRIMHVVEFGDSNNVMKDAKSIPDYIPYAIPSRHRGKRK